MGRGSSTYVFRSRVRTVRESKNCTHIYLIPRLAPKFRNRYKAAHLFSRASSRCIGSREQRSFYFTFRISYVRLPSVSNLYFCFPFLSSTLHTSDASNGSSTKCSVLSLFRCSGVFLRKYEYKMNALLVGTPWSPTATMRNAIAVQFLPTFLGWVLKR